jgi:4-amino-4-deoxy-L-arabinose transferase-like glycosyltransferase
MILGEAISDDIRLYSQLFTNAPPLAAWLSHWLYVIFGRAEIGWRVFSLFLLFFQVAFFTILLINNKAHHENTYLPGLIYGLLALFSFDMLSYSPELMASTLMLFALNELFKEIEFRIQRDAIVHGIGFFVGLASLFVLSYAVFLPGTFILLVIFARLNARKALLLVFGFLLPHLILILIYYLRGDLQLLIQNFYLGSFSANAEGTFSFKSLLILGAVPLLFFILSLVMLNREARLTKYQSQLLQVMFLWLPLSAIVLAFSPEIKPHHLVIFLPPLSYFISHYILLIRRKRLAEITIWLFVISVLGVLYLSRANFFQHVKYQKLYAIESTRNQVRDKRVLILTDDSGLLLRNRLATGFYNWKLSEPIFLEQDYFENVILIERAFEQGKPEIIVDPKNLMTTVFRRIPSLQANYKREGELYVRIN